MNINLTEKEVEFLEQYADVYRKERKIDCTADPIVLVQTRVEKPTSYKYGYDGCGYSLSVNYYPITEDSLLKSIEEVKKEIYKSFEIELKKYNKDGYTEEDFAEALDELIDEIEEYFECENERPYVLKNQDFDIRIEVEQHFFKYEYETIAYFFTRAEAEKYVKYQGHNLNQPRVYTDYAGYDNQGDYPVLQKLLLKMGETLNGIGEDDGNYPVDTGEPLDELPF